MANLVGHETNHQDPSELRLEGRVNFNDPLERAAIAAHRLTFATPPDVAGALTADRDGLEDTWLRLDPPTRQLYRKRADVILEAHAGLGARA